ncbi:RNA polymerase sigma factor [Phenylobacterium sp.]|uniref:RNA polymerase sigma factor n=1 Tax=Phenylobacterium sp. TaxID=1871053 RepID=UPI002FC79A74
MCMSPPPGLADHVAHQRIDSLYRETYPTLLRFLSGRLSNAEDAKDVANETFVRLLRDDEGRPERLTAAMVFTIAGNIAIDILRQRTRRGDTHLADLPAGEDLAADQPSPEATCAARFELQRTLTWLDDLPPKCRYAFVQHRVWAADYAAIAAELSLTESMIRKYVLRAQRHCSRMASELAA